MCKTLRSTRNSLDFKYLFIKNLSMNHLADLVINILKRLNLFWFNHYQSYCYY